MEFTLPTEDLNNTHIISLVYESPMGSDVIFRMRLEPKNIVRWNETSLKARQLKTKIEVSQEDMKFICKRGESLGEQNFKFYKLNEPFDEFDHDYELEKNHPSYCYCDVYFNTVTPKTSSDDSPVTIDKPPRHLVYPLSCTISFKKTASSGEEWFKGYCELWTRVEKTKV